MPLANENMTSTLGMAGSLGLLILLASLLMPQDRSAEGEPSIPRLARICLILILFASVGRPLDDFCPLYQPHDTGLEPGERLH